MMSERPPIGAMLSRCRASAAITQQQLADALHVTPRTIYKWEHDITAPSLYDAIDFLVTCGKNPMHEFLAWLYPELCGADQNDAAASRRKMLAEYVQNRAGDAELEELAYLITGDHGSSWLAYLQLCVAYLNLPLQYRHRIASMLVNDYRMAAAMGTIVESEGPLPDEALLSLAITEAEAAIISGKPGYTILEGGDRK